ncbi:MAG TPA: ATP-binding protein [Myxococcaceae bacterium]|nr:ATP-binding protein [Myxococcaceae bacterium]
MRESAVWKVRSVELRAEDDTQRHREKLARIVLDEMYQFVGLLDAKGTLLEVNRAALEGGGIHLEDIQGRPFWEARWWAVSTATQEQLRGAIRRAASGEFVRYDVEIFGSADGSETIIIDFSLVPVRDNSGRVVFLLAEGRNITEKKRAEEEVARQKEELEALLARVRELDELKSQLFANVSHELRTPLALILGPAEAMLAHGDNLTARQRRDVSVMRRNAATLLKHVNDLLDVAKMDAGKMTLSYAEEDLAALVVRVGGHFEALAPQKNIAFVVATEGSLPAQVDIDKLERVLINLLSNAFKFTPEGGRVRVGLERTRDGRRALLSVQDSGPGIPPAQRTVVFERFRQAEGGSTRQFGGTGLGLSIVKDFVGLHGGLVSVTEAPGGGALFQIELPLAAPEGAVVRKRSRVQNAGSEAEMALRGTLEELRPLAKRSELPEVLDPGADARPRVLVVEDNQELGRFIVETLEAEFQVSLAPDGEEGLSRAKERPPDLILTDVMMPKMSGDLLLARLRGEAGLSHVPVMVLSAKADDGLRIRLLRGGAQDYLVKPFLPEELLVRARNLVLLKKKSDELEVRNAELSRLRAQAEARADEEKQRSEERYRLLVDSVKDYAIFSLDSEGRVDSWNSGAERILGYRPDEILKTHFRAFFPPEDVDSGKAERLLKEALLNGQTKDIGLRARRDGSLFWAEGVITPLRDTSGALRGYAKVVRDVTERVQWEESLRRSEEHFRMLAEAIPQIVWVTRPDGFHEYYNRQWYEYTGSTHQEAEGEGWNALFHPDDRERARQVWRRSLSTGELYEIEYRLRRASDGEYRWFLGRALPLRDAEGRIVRWFGTCTDIHDQKLAEAGLKRAVQLRDEFLSVAAHELRTPLTSLKLQLELVARAARECAIAPSPQLEGRLASAHRQVGRLNQLNNALLDVTRIGAGKLRLELEEMDLSEMVAETVERMTPEFERAGCAVTASIQPNVRGIWDRLRLEQVLTNLLNNAVRYGAGKPVNVELSSREPDVVLRVHDQGIGIAPEDQERIFRRFERAAPVHNYGGLGLGLFISREVVHAMGGDIHLESKPSQGSVFTVRIPHRQTGPRP